MNKVSARYNRLKASIPCMLCGRWLPTELHHAGQEQKNDAVSNMINSKMGSKAVSTECKKCIPLCQNCHKRCHRPQKHRGAQAFADYNNMILERYQAIYDDWVQLVDTMFSGKNEDMAVTIEQHRILGEARWELYQSTLMART